MSKIDPQKVKAVTDALMAMGAVKALVIHVTPDGSLNCVRMNINSGEEVGLAQMHAHSILNGLSRANETAVPKSLEDRKQELGVKVLNPTEKDLA